MPKKKLERHYQDCIRKGIERHLGTPSLCMSVPGTDASFKPSVFPSLLCWLHLLYADLQILFHCSHFLTSFPAPQCIVLWFASVLWSPFWTLVDKKTVVYFFPKVIGTGDNKGYPLACWSGTLMYLAHLQLACKSRYCRMNRCSVLCTAHSQWGATQLWA